MRFVYLLALCFVLGGAHLSSAQEPKFDQDPIYIINGNEITITLPTFIDVPDSSTDKIELHKFTYDHMLNLVKDEGIEDIIATYPDLLRMDDRVSPIHYMKGNGDGANYTFTTAASSTAAKTTATAKFNYLRTGKGFKVYDLKGGKDSRIYFFGKTPFAGKSKSDPNPLNYDVVYLDGTGNKVFQSQFEFGHKKNALDPVFGYFQNGQIHVLVQNIKAKNAFSQLVFDLNGKLIKETPEQARKDLFDLVKTAKFRINKNKYPNLTLDDWLISSVRQDGQGNIFAIGQLGNEKFVGEGNDRKLKMFYKSPFVIQMTEDEIGQIYIFDSFQPNKDGVPNPFRIFPIRANADHVMVLAKKSTGKQGVRLLKLEKGKQPIASKLLGEGAGLNYGLKRAWHDEKKLPR